MARAPAPGHCAGMEVFIVEDSPAVLGRLLELLQAVPGVRVIGHAAGAGEAIGRILELQPQLVVLDLKLAQGSGFDVLRAIHERAPGIELYMLSNFSAEPYRRQATALGAKDFFDKTRDFGRVRDLVAARAAALDH